MIKVVAIYHGRCKINGYTGANVLLFLGLAVYFENFRLQCHIEVNTDLNQFVDGQQLYDDYKSEGGACSMQSFAHCLRFCFPNVVTRRGYSQIYKRTVNIYVGVHQRPVTPRDSEKLLTLADLKHCIPDGFYVASESEEKLSVFTVCSETVSGVKLSKEVTFCTNKRWYLTVGGKDIQLNELGISDSYDFMTESIHAVCSIVEKT